MHEIALHGVPIPTVLLDTLARRIAAQSRT
jgi:hypothetical protein